MPQFRLDGAASPQTEAQSVGVVDEIQEMQPSQERQVVRNMPVVLNQQRLASTHTCIASESMRGVSQQLDILGRGLVERKFLRIVPFINIVNGTEASLARQKESLFQLG